MIKLVYMGTSSFAVPALRMLARREDTELLFSVTRPDAPAGRGKRLTPPPVKIAAEELGIKVIQPEKIKDNDEFAEVLESASPDLIAVASYGKILTEEILSIPRFGCINIHASLLPKYRGAAPIQRAILAGEEFSGVSLMYMSAGLDEGSVITSSSLPIAGLDAGELTGKLADLGAELLSLQLETISHGDALSVPQDDKLATYAPPIMKEEGRIRSEEDAETTLRRVLAMSPVPGAYALLGGVKYKIGAAKICEDLPGADISKAAKYVPGSVVCAGSEGLVLAMRGGLLVIDRLQAPGGKLMGAADFFRGHKIELGLSLG